MTYQTEFPDYPAAAMPELPDGFADRSWRNEPCPCFIHEASGFVLWIDYPENRELDDCARFVVQRCGTRDREAGWQLDGGLVELFQTDDWSVVTSSLPNFLAELQDEIDGGDTPAEAAVTLRLRNNLTTQDDARAIIAENAAAASPCPDLHAGMAAILFCHHAPICGNCERELAACRASPCSMIYPVCRECMDDLDPHAIARRWVKRLGLGFHPDTAGADYLPAMHAEEVAEYDRDMETLFAIADDPYACGLMAMKDEGLC